jgi:hypothetical protein
MPHAEKRAGKLTGFWYGEEEIMGGILRGALAMAMVFLNATRGFSEPSAEQINAG